MKRAISTALLLFSAIAPSLALAQGAATSTPAAAQPPAREMTPAPAEMVSTEAGGGSDLEQRLITRFEISWAPSYTIVNGNPGTVGETFREGSIRLQTNQLQGTLALGTRGLGLSALNTYVLARGSADLDGVPAIIPQGDPSEAPAVFPVVEDRVDGAKALWLHLAYGELEGLSEEGALSKVTIRAGRQYHWGMAGLTFDGATVGYGDRAFEIRGRVGQRKSVFRTNEDAGFVAGGDATYRVDLKNERELAIGVEYLHFQRDIVLRTRDQRLLGSGVGSGTSRVEMAELRALWDLSEDASAHGEVSFVSPEISHIRAGVSWQKERLGITFDIDQKIGQDLFYDLAGGVGVFQGDRALTIETLKLNIPDLQPYTDLSAWVSYALLDWLEVDFTPGARFVHGDVENRSSYDANRISWGLGARGRFALDESAGLEADLLYDGILYSRDDDGRDFTGIGGEKMSNGVTLGLRYARGDRFQRGRMLGGQRVSAGIAGYFRGSRFDNPLLAEAVEEGVLGFRADARWAFSEHIGVQGIYEYVVDSNLFTPHLGGYNLARLSIEGRY
jgi:hypothetical protein